MKKKPQARRSQLPIDFGNEELRPVPIQKPARPSRNGHALSAQTNEPKKNGRTRKSAEFAPVELKDLIDSKFRIQNSSLPRRGGFTLIEILVVLVLLSLIVFALMAVFSTTQRAFRASVTQTDSNESGRAVMNLIADEMEAMAPSYSISNILYPTVACPVNFMSNAKTFSSYPPSPLYQPLIGSPSGALRTNVLEDVFILGKGNINGVPSWIATGYSVSTNLPDGTLYPLYRFYMTTNVTSGFTGLTNLFYSFIQFNYTNAVSWSHLMDGVVHLTARTYDTNGIWMTNGYANPSSIVVPHDVTFVFNGLGETSCIFCSNALPAYVQIQLGTFEDRTLQHAEGLRGAPQSNYLANASSAVHLFTRRVWIRNLDPTAYQ